MLFLLLLIRSSAASECGSTQKLADLSPYKFQSNEPCSWTFIGEQTCIPSISCDKSVEITDGAGGLADKSGTSNTRDLFIKYELNEKLTCTIKCGDGTLDKIKLTQKPKLENRCHCGMQNREDRIVGGEDAAMNEFPWQVAIVFANTRSPKCGGSIINDRYVLTAAHCFVFEKTQPKDIQVLFHARVLDFTLQQNWKDVELGGKGSIRGSGYKEKKRTDDEEKTQRYNVMEIINHPLFTRKYDYDVSLLKLEKKIDLSKPDAPTPICLPNVMEYGDYVGSQPWVVGWGLAHEAAGASTKILQKLQVPVLGTGKCQKLMKNYELTPRMLCAGFEEGGKDACTGDSGGPLSLKGKYWEQVGIVSWGEGCAKEKRPGLYSRVTDLNAWIREMTKGAGWCRSD